LTAPLNILQSHTLNLRGRIVGNVKCRPVDLAGLKAMLKDLAES